MGQNPRIGELSGKRSLLKGEGRYREAIPLQLEIIELLQADKAPQERLASAHNMASVLYLGAKLYSSAEWHARQALVLHTDDSAKGREAFGAYHIVLARVLASQFDFEQAAHHGGAAVSAYSHWHDPPDEFLLSIKDEVEAMRNRTWCSPQ